MERGDGPPPQATGERLVPELQYGQVVHAEHLARYLVAAQLAQSRRVLDAACGEGYGTNLLARAGARVAVGIDLDEPTLAHARRRYPATELVQGDVRQLPFADGEFELVVSFETIEHVAEPERVLDEFARVLAADGMLIISTPNKHQYLVENEFHEREFPHEEFVALLKSRFSSVELLLQHNWLASSVLPVSAAQEASGADIAGTRFTKLTGIVPGDELYTVALCGTGRIAAPPPMVVGADLDESHQLATRVVSAEREAERWHEEYVTARGIAENWHREFERATKVAEEWHGEYQAVVGVYDSVWWRMTAPLRRVADLLRRRRG